MEIFDVIKTLTINADAYNKKQIEALLLQFFKRAITNGKTTEEAVNIALNDYEFWVNMKKPQVKSA